MADGAGDARRGVGLSWGRVAGLTEGPTYRRPAPAERVCLRSAARHSCCRRA